MNNIHDMYNIRKGARMAIDLFQSLGYLPKEKPIIYYKEGIKINKSSMDKLICYTLIDKMKKDISFMEDVLMGYEYKIKWSKIEYKGKLIMNIVDLIIDK